MEIPSVWTEPFTKKIENELRNEADIWFRVHQLNDNSAKWDYQKAEIKKFVLSQMGATINHKLPLDYHETFSIKMDDYTVKGIFYQSRPGVYVTGNLYIPDGNGPFPSVINMHGHWKQGRLTERVQQRGHSLAKNGYVCLAIDAFGSGERSDIHGGYEYHGANLVFNCKSNK